MKFAELLTPHEKIELLRLVEKMPTTTPCNACVNYDCGYCKIPKEKIPDDIINVGCEDWQFAPNSPPF